MSELKLWFGDYENHYIGEGLGFLSVEEVEMLQNMENLFSNILQEVAVLWENKQNIASLYGDFDAFDDKQFPPNSWKKIVIKVWGLYNLRLQNHFPILFDFVKNYPEISSCFITKTLPNSYIKPHCGETNGIFRLHMGLKVPAQNGEMCSIKMNHHLKDWETGKAFGFLDAQQHEVWNKTNEERYVLIIDIIRPEFRKHQKYISSRIITTQILFAYGTKILGNHLIEKTPRWLMNLLTKILFYPIQLITAINNKWGLVKL